MRDLRRDEEFFGLCSVPRRQAALLTRVGVQGTILRRVHLAFGSLARIRGVRVLSGNVATVIGWAAMSTLSRVRTVGTRRSGLIVWGARIRVEFVRSLEATFVLGPVLAGDAFAFGRLGLELFGFGLTSLSFGGIRVGFCLRLLRFGLLHFDFGFVCPYAGSGLGGLLPQLGRFFTLTFAFLRSGFAADCNDDSHDDQDDDDGDDDPDDGCCVHAISPCWLFGCHW